MTGKTVSPIKVNDRALEMLMRDVLDGMIEFTLDTAFIGGAMDFEILEIRPEHASDHRSGKDYHAKREVKSAEIIPFPLMQQAS